MATITVSEKTRLNLHAKWASAIGAQDVLQSANQAAQVSANRYLECVVAILEGFGFHDIAPDQVQIDFATGVVTLPQGIEQESLQAA